jgi:hypothetical protein
VTVKASVAATLEKATPMIRCGDEPTLDELIGDPITQAIMTADRVDQPTLEAMLRSLAHEIVDRTESARLGSAAGQRSWPIGVSRDTASCCISGSRIRSQPCGAP